MHNIDTVIIHCDRLPVIFI